MFPFTRRQGFWAVLSLLLTLLLTPALPTSAAGLASQGDGCAGGSCAVGAVYALTNAPGGNAVVAYHRAADGGLTPVGTFGTGGAGTGTGLGSQGAVVVSEDHRFLFAVNAGSNSLSSFRILPDGLALVGVVPSGGTMPTSVAHQHGLLYALNAGVPNTV